MFDDLSKSKSRSFLKRASGQQRVNPMPFRVSVRLV